MAAEIEQLYRRRESTISARVLEETVILDLDGDRYTRLNGSAGMLWEELADARSVEQLAARLAEVFAIDQRRARADARKLIERLDEQRLIERVG